MQSMISVEELCRKLKPILGKKIDNLYMQYTLTDSRDKRLEIEQTLNALYQKYLNPDMLNEKILLEPPKKEVIQGDYPLGIVTYADKDLHTFGLREQDWIRHVCINGMSGSGKTNFAFQILGNFITKKKPFLVFDWKKSFRPLLLLDKSIMLFTVGNNISNLFKFNINRPPKNVAPKEWINFLCDLISECFNTSFGVHKVLLEVLDKAFKDFGVYEGSGNYPTWYQIKDRLDKKAQDLDRKNRESEWIVSAQRIAHSLTFGNFGEAVNYKGSGLITIEDLFNKKVIFELHTLNNTEKKFFCEFILAYIYKYKKMNDLEGTNEFRYAILVDEAHNIFLKDKPNFIKESIPDLIYREIREYGISLICLDQHISKLSDTVSGNSACNVAFQQVLPHDVECIASLTGIKYYNKNYFSMLPVGHAIVRLAERYHSPFTVKIPYVELKDRKVSDSKIAEMMKETAKANNLVAESHEEYKLKKRLEEIDKLDKIFKVSGVEADEDFLEKQLEIKESMQSAIDEEKAKPIIVNHLQEGLVEQISNLILKNSLASIKDYLKCQGYKNADINAAVKYVLSKKKNNEIQKDELEKVPKIIDLNDEEKKFLHYIYKYPNKTVTEIYKGLNLSARKGNEIKNDFIELGFVKIKEEKNEKGWRKYLELSKEVKNYFSNPENQDIIIY